MHQGWAAPAQGRALAARPRAARTSTNSRKRRGAAEAPRHAWPRARPCRAVCAVLLALSAWSSAALGEPSSPSEAAAREAILREQRERELRRQQEAAPDVRLPRATEQADPPWPQEQPCFPIRSVLLVGQQAERFVFALEPVTGGAAPALGRCLGGKGVALLASRVQNAIVDRGYVTTRVLVEPQDLKSGQLRLTVVAGRLQQVRFAEGTDEARATAWNAVPRRADALLNLRDVEQALENLKRVPSVDADIDIEPSRAESAGPGDSDLVIRWHQATPWRLQLSIDDGGSEATGKYQGALTLSYDHWWTLNDLFYVSINRDLGGGESGERGTRGHTVHYSVPSSYWLFGMTVGAHRYQQAVAGASQTYLYSGENRTGEVKVSRLMYRDAARKTSASLRGWWRASRNYIDDTEIHVQRRRAAGWELGVSHREFIGTATLDAGIQYRRGTGARHSLPAPEEAFGEGTSRARVFTADAQGTVPFALAGQRLRYTGSWRAQWNRTPLVPQDRFSIGGRYTVRGFDGEHVLSAERGWLWRNDLGLALPAVGAELYLGVDHGRVGGPSSERLVGRHLTGTVLGVRGAWQRLNYDLFVGTPLRKPSGFRAPDSTAGFQLFVSF